MYFVYVIQNQGSKRLYAGHTQDLEQRLGQHNCGITKSTKNRGRWELVYHESFATRGEAMRRERFLKSGQGREEIQRILTQRLEGRAAG
jgi:putative endonuclease